MKAEVSRSRTVAENISLNDRDRVWFEITDEMIKDLDKELDVAIRNFLQPFLLA